MISEAPNNIIALANDVVSRAIAKPPNIQDCIRAIVRCKGKFDTAAEDLGIQPEDLALALVEHKQEAYQAVEAIALMSAFDNYSFAGGMMKATLAKLAEDKGTDGAAVIARTYIQLLSEIKSITNPKVPVGVSTNVFSGQNNFSIDQRLLESLRPEERQAIMVLAGEQQTT